MTRMRKIGVMIALCAGLLMMGTASALQARVNVKKGELNMRKSAKNSASIVASIPKDAMVEVLQEDGEWCKVTYKNKTGYVKSEFLLLPSGLVGKTVYPDEGSAVLLAAEETEAAMIAVTGPDEGLLVIKVGEEYAQVQVTKGLFSGAEGYLSLDKLSRQYTEAGEGMSLYPEEAIFVKEASLSADKEGKQAKKTAPIGDTALIIQPEGRRCLVQYGGELLYADAASLYLKGLTEESHDTAGATITWVTARDQCKAYLAQQIDLMLGENVVYDYTMENPYPGIEGSFYRFTVSDYNGRVLCTLRVNARGRGVIACCDWRNFAAQGIVEEKLPSGYAALTVQEDLIAPGEAVHLQVTASCARQYDWQILKEETVISQGTSGLRSKVAWRIAEEGEYTALLTVTFEDGTQRTLSETFIVTNEAPRPEGMRIYSQRDGYWRKVAYGDSTLNRSGCAIFALSHALQWLGYEGENITPEVLAKKNSSCRVEGGTNNQLLIRKNASVFGYTTESELVTDPNRIASLLKEGNVFTFSVALGHIAMAAELSQDGTKVKIIDSCPLATFERAEVEGWYVETRGGDFMTLLSPETLPGLWWYFETQNWGGAAYWMSLDYVASRGVRLIGK